MRVQAVLALTQGARAAILIVMTATALLELKQRASMLNERDRRSLSAHLIKLGQQGATAKREASRRLDEMAAGRKISVADLRRQLGHG